jgi:hypothetical protein
MVSIYFLDTTKYQVSDLKGAGLGIFVVVAPQALEIASEL